MAPRTVYKTIPCDVLVIGSGVSGYCAAIQAGRCGCDVILLEKDEKDNYHRFCEHRFASLSAGRLRLTVHATHGPGHSARVYQVSVYGGDASPRGSA